RQANAFSQAHLAMLQAVSKQVAISIYNTELYGEQAQRINDMATIGALTNLNETSSDANSTYQALNSRVAKIVGAGVAGVLIYDENRHALLPELPFYGLPDQVAQTTVIPLPADSPQRDIYERQDYWVTNDVADESLIEALGLKETFGVAGIKSMA